MNPILVLAYEAWGVGELEMRAGFKDCETRLQNGTAATVRVARQSPDAQLRLLADFAASGDPKILLGGMLRPEQATDEFLSSLALGELTRLANVATALVVGPDAMKQMIEAGEHEAIQQAETSPSNN